MPPPSTLASPLHRQARCTQRPPLSFRGHGGGGRRTVEDRHGVSPLAEEASSPYEATSVGSSCRTRRLLEQSAKPALPRSGATLPEAAQAAKQSPARLRGIPPRQLHSNAGLMALQREPAYLKVSVGTSAKGTAGTRSGLGSVLPFPLSRFDQVPVSLDPPSDRAERLVK
jgi:hypothetical protein